MMSWLQKNKKVRKNFPRYDWIKGENRNPKEKSIGGSKDVLKCVWKPLMPSLLFISISHGFSGLSSSPKAKPH